MSTDPDRARRTCLGLLAGGVVGVAGCIGDRTETGTTDDPSPPETDAKRDGTPTDEPQTDSVENRIVRLSPLEDRREVRSTGLVAMYPTDVIGWLREAAADDRTLRRHVSTGREMPDPPLQALRDVRFVDDGGELDGHYDLEVDAGTRYEMLVEAEPADPPADAEVTSVAALAEERRDLAVAAIEDDTEGSRVYPETELGEWVREAFFDGYYRYEGETYRGHEARQPDAASSSTEAWYVLSASPSREGDDDTSLLLPDFDEAVLTELDAAAVGERTTDLVVEDPSEPLAAFADRTAMLVTHLAIFRVRLETA